MEEDLIKYILFITGYNNNCSKTRKGNIVKIRQLTHYLLATKTNMNYTKITSLVGSCSRTIIYHSIKTVENQLKIYPKFKEEYNKLDNMITKFKNSYYLDYSI